MHSDCEHCPRRSECLLNANVKETRHEILSSVFNIPLATGTIKNMVTRCADSLKNTQERIRLALIALGLIHCDETGTRVDGRTWWVHDASKSQFTYLTISKKRGQVGMEEAGVLPYASGIIIHDCWGSYWKYKDVIHGICCAHLLRELNGVIENHPEQTWAPRFRKLLLDMKKSRIRLYRKGRMKSAIIICTSSIWRMMTSSEPHMRKTRFPKYQ